MRICTIVGARPQFVKAAVVSRALRRQAGVTELLIHTGQHFDANMSKIFFDELGIPQPSHHLGVGGGSHAHNTGRAMEGIEKVIADERPDLVLVYGDTDSTLAGALAAAKACVPLAHVEAGLRSHNRRMPEEVNRVVTDHLSTLLFAPSKVAENNLAREGISGDKVHVVGDVMYDAVLVYAESARQRSTVLSRLGLTPGDYLLATIHRKENTDDATRLAGLFAGLASSGRPVVLPLHPRTRKRLDEHRITLPSSVQVIDPVGYLDMLQLSRCAAVIATDSGGLQKEAYFLGVPSLVLRDETEWVELVEIKATRLVGADPRRIADALAQTRTRVEFRAIYGESGSSDRIAAALVQGGRG